MKRYIIFFLSTAAVLTLGYIGFNSVKNGTETPVNISAVRESTKVPTATIIPQLVRNVPLKLIIPSIGVEAEIEQTGKDEEGKMDVPKIDTNVAWWKYGVKPGEIGNAVFAGHYDNRDGGPSVFYRLKDLEAGDKLEVEDFKGNKLIFKVTKKEVYKDSQFPIEKVFGETSTKSLNLITCEGEWDKNAKNYSDRLVVFSELIES